MSIDLIKGEVWLPVVGYEAIYKVSNIGRVCNIKKKKILLSFKNKKGYNVYRLSKDKVSKTAIEHRIVAKAFLKNPENKGQVNHKNAIKNDNRVENLEWATHQENMDHAKVNNLYPGQKGSTNPNWGKTGKDNHNFSAKSPHAKTIIQLTMKGDFIKRWDCGMDIFRELKICNKQVSNVVSGKRKSAQGFIWQYEKI